jgi:2-polyprenyl-3-methyl-5-hydroxy-6-metoxy-1,4-benzoquinol methylase
MAVSRIQTAPVVSYSDASSFSIREASCLLCGSNLATVLAGVTDNRLGAPGVYEIRRCVSCGLEQTFPIPKQSVLTQLYERYYNFGGIRDTLYTRLRERFLSSFLNRFWTTIDGDVAFQLRKGSGRLLDIGCNEGRGLKIFARNGFQVEGLELNTNAAAVAREGGFTVHTCLLEEFHPTQSFNVAVLSNVLEHTLEPRQMLVDVNRVLGDGGQIWISCPNARSWLRGMFGKRWINWHVPFHISHFSETTLRQLLERTGYGDIEIRQITPALWLAQSAIASLFAKPGQKTRQLRNPFLTLIFMTLARLVVFPALWLGNRLGQGDCLQIIATKRPQGASLAVSNVSR